MPATKAKENALNKRLVIAFAKAALKTAQVNNLMMLYDDSVSIGCVFNSTDTQEFIMEILDGFSDEEQELLLRPGLAAAIQEITGAQNVSITW